MYRPPASPLSYPNGPLESPIVTSDSTLVASGGTGRSGPHLPPDR
jgi:hypothetical protein